MAKKKTGIEVTVTSPIHKTYQIEGTSDPITAEMLVKDTLLRKGLVKTLADFKCTTKKYQYKEVSLGGYWVGNTWTPSLGTAVMLRIKKAFAR